MISSPSDLLQVNWRIISRYTIFNMYVSILNIIASTKTYTGSLMKGIRCRPGALSLCVGYKSIFNVCFHLKNKTSLSFFPSALLYHRIPKMYANNEKVDVPIFRSVFARALPFVTAVSSPPIIWVSERIPIPVTPIPGKFRVRVTRSPSWV